MAEETKEVKDEDSPFSNSSIESEDEEQFFDFEDSEDF